MGDIIKFDRRIELIRGNGEPSMETHFEKYLDIRFAHIEEDVKEIRSDVKEIRSDIKGLRSWYIGTTIVIIGILVGLITYHAQVMQSQMSVFADYVKAVTLPQK